MLKNKKQKISLLIGISLFAIGCGSSSSTITNSTTNSTETLTISGTVPGTLIEAFCKDGSYYKTNSTDNGTTAHPFTLTVPKALDCKLVMTTNENDSNISKRIVTPIQFSNTVSSSTYFSLNTDVNIGNIPLEMNSTGVQPVFDLSLSDTDTGLNIRELSYDPLDIDGDGIPNVYEDDDADGQYNKDDNDTDHQNDIDGDGIPDNQDSDKDNDGVIDNNTITSTTSTLPTSFIINDGRLLGANCAQCHGTNGISTNSWDSIAGEGNLLGEFRERKNALMYSVSHGFTDAQVNLIGSWLGGIASSNNEGEDND